MSGFDRARPAPVAQRVGRLETGRKENVTARKRCGTGSQSGKLRHSREAKQ